MGSRTCGRGAATTSPTPGGGRRAVDLGVARRVLGDPHGAAVQVEDRGGSGTGDGSGEGGVTGVDDEVRHLERLAPGGELEAPAVAERAPDVAGVGGRVDGHVA